MQSNLDAEGHGELTVRLEIAEGWHIYAADPGGEGLIGTTIKAVGVERLEIEMPAGEPWQPSPEQPPIRVYEGALELHGRVVGAGEGAGLEIRFQACDDHRCLAPRSVRLAF